VSYVKNSRKSKSYSGGYLDLLAKKQLSAFSKFLSDITIKKIPLLLLSMVPWGGSRIARLLHIWVSPYSKCKWYN